MYHPLLTPHRSPSIERGVIHSPLNLKTYTTGCSRGTIAGVWSVLRITSSDITSLCTPATTVALAAPVLGYTFKRLQRLHTPVVGHRVVVHQQRRQLEAAAVT